MARSVPISLLRLPWRVKEQTGCALCRKSSGKDSTYPEQSFCHLPWSGAGPGPHARFDKNGIGENKSQSSGLKQWTLIGEWGMILILPQVSYNSLHPTYLIRGEGRNMIVSHSMDLLQAKMARKGLPTQTQCDCLVLLGALHSSLIVLYPISIWCQSWDGRMANGKWLSRTFQWENCRDWY